MEIWQSDGTEAGTFQISDLWPGGCDPYPDYLVIAGETLFFAGRDDAVGEELWKIECSILQGLLRNKDIYQLVPDVRPHRSGILPLSPVNDLYIPNFTSGSIDPEVLILEDTAHPLVFYAMSSPGVIYLAPTAAGEIRIDY
ncbi:hypothetical protein ACFLU6_04940 [Acidobacteriota bacterium]